MNDKKISGVSLNAVLLTFIKLITTVLGLVSTRLLSVHLSAHEYGTYSQILLIVSTISSITVLGLIDAVNYFHSGQSENRKKQTYVSTIYALETIVSVVAGIGVVVAAEFISTYMANEQIKKYIVFAAVLPYLQNLLFMTQVLVVAAGKAKLLALRNFTVHFLKLIVVGVVVYFYKNIGVILLFSVVLDVLQLILFFTMLSKQNVKIKIKYIDFTLVKSILKYALPMAVFVALNSLNRDCDKYVISLFTNTETLAVYANASKLLPFDILISSFITVLVPKITELISKGEKEKTVSIYKRFLEISYISTGILTSAAIVVSAELMTLLYSEKYLSGLNVFILYIVVDMLRFMSITLILSAAGKTKKLMSIAGATVGLNIILNVVFFKLFGIVGPAIATVAVSFLSGVAIMKSSAEVLETKMLNFFDVKFLLCFIAESIITVCACSFIKDILSEFNLNYFVLMVIICFIYGSVMVLLNGKRLFNNLKNLVS